MILTAVLFIAIAATQVADVITTNALLKRRGARELNPVMRWLQRKCGRLWPLPKIAVIVIAAAIGYLVAGNWTLALVAAVGAIGPAWNVVQLTRST